MKEQQGAVDVERSDCVFWFILQNFIVRILVGICIIPSPLSSGQLFFFWIWITHFGTSLKVRAGFQTRSLASMLVASTLTMLVVVGFCVLEISNSRTRAGFYISTGRPVPVGIQLCWENESRGIQSRI